MSKLRCRILIAFTSLVSGAAIAAYPNAPIELIVPFPPGGSVDPIARAMQEGLQSTLSTSVIVLNQPGAGGTLGTTKVAHSAPNGYTLGMPTVGPLATQPHMNTLSYHIDSFEYVCRTHVTPQVLVVPANSPYKTLAELVEDARKHPEKISLASTGTGSVPHLAAVAFGQLAGFEWMHIPTKGDSEALQLSLGGEITGWIAGVQTFSRMSDRLRALGILEQNRSMLLPEIPTFSEQGFPLVSAGWGGLVTPKGTPPDVIETLSKACEAATGTPKFESVLQSLMVPQGYLPADAFKTFAESEYARYGELIRSIGAAVKD